MEGWSQRPNSKIILPQRRVSPPRRANPKRKAMPAREKQKRRLMLAREKQKIKTSQSPHFSTIIARRAWRQYVESISRGAALSPIDSSCWMFSCYPCHKCGSSTISLGLTRPSFCANCGASIKSSTPRFLTYWLAQKAGRTLHFA